MLIRLATAADGARVAAIYAPAVSQSPTSFELTPPTPEEMARRIGALTVRTPWLVGESGGQVLGYAYASPHRDRPAYDWSVEVSAYVDSAAVRTGIGRALYTSLFAILTLQGFRNAYAGITQPNPASVGLHEAMGFEMVGVYREIGYKRGRWHDVAWYQRGLAPRDLDPAPPLPLAALLGTESLQSALESGVASPGPSSGAGSRA